MDQNRQNNLLYISIHKRKVMYDVNIKMDKKEKEKKA